MGAAVNPGVALAVLEGEAGIGWAQLDGAGGIDRGVGSVDFEVLGDFSGGDSADRVGDEGNGEEG